MNRIAPVVEELSLWVDHKMFVLAGGYDGWVKQGGPVQSDKIRTKIVYLPKPGPGEIVGDEFMNIVNSEPEDKTILDVRSAEESVEGKIDWAVKIPLDDLKGSLGSLSKDKEIIIHCSTGMRAQMAYSVLKEAGYKTRFLNDKIAFVNERPICCFKE
jgi:rhodanese-related sulfurtransferase